MICAATRIAIIPAIAIRTRKRIIRSMTKINRELYSDKDMYGWAMVELKNSSTRELEKIASDTAYHNWFRRAAQDTLKKREGKKNDD